jgi:hypothetical protein
MDRIQLDLHILQWLYKRNFFLFFYCPEFLEYSDYQKITPPLYYKFYLKI